MYGKSVGLGYMLGLLTLIMVVVGLGLNDHAPRIGEEDEELKVVEAPQILGDPALLATVQARRTNGTTVTIFLTPEEAGNIRLGQSIRAIRVEIRPEGPSIFDGWRPVPKPK